MIIKEKSIKSYIALERTLRYILSKDIHGKENFVLRRFIKGDRGYEKQLVSTEGDAEATSIVMENRLENIQEQFRENDGHRLHKRKGETKFYHCILSFSKLDRLNREQLQMVARTYAKMRFPKSIVVATNHTDTGHQHIHLIGSNVEYGTHTTRYLTKSQFRDIKNRMEAWQERVLKLEYSRVDHAKKKQRFLGRRNTNSTSKAGKVKSKNL